MFIFVLFCSFEEIYGWVFFLKFGSYKCVIVLIFEVVNEMLVKKLVDFVGRLKIYFIEKGMLGRGILCNCRIIFLIKMEFIFMKMLDVGRYKCKVFVVWMYVIRYWLKLVELDSKILFFKG